MLDHDRRGRALPRLHEWDRGESTGHAIPGRRPDRRAAGRFIHAQSTATPTICSKPLAEPARGDQPARHRHLLLLELRTEATEAAVKLAKQATGRPTSWSSPARSTVDHLTMAMTTSKTATAPPRSAAVGCSWRRSPAGGRRVDPDRVTQCLDGSVTCSRRERAAETAAIRDRAACSRGRYDRPPHGSHRLSEDLPPSTASCFRGREVQSGSAATARCSRSRPPACG